MGGLCYDWVTYMKEDELGGANRDWEKTGELLSSAAGDGRTILQVAMTTWLKEHTRVAMGWMVVAKVTGRADKPGNLKCGFVSCHPTLNHELGWICWRWAVVIVCCHTVASAVHSIWVIFQWRPVLIAWSLHLVVDGVRCILLWHNTDGLITKQHLLQIFGKTPY